MGLFTYPVLQAADILLYDADRVPVGDDQRQHLELARDLAIRFNGRYGDTFVVPEAAIPALGAKIMDLQDPMKKMSKSADSPQGTVALLDSPEVITKKIKRAVTDSETEASLRPRRAAGRVNLLELLAVATGATPEEVAAGYTQYGPLKADTAAAVVEFLRPLHERVRRAGRRSRRHRHHCSPRAPPRPRPSPPQTLARAKDAIGLLPR